MSAQSIGTDEALTALRGFLAEPNFDHLRMNAFVDLCERLRRELPAEVRLDLAERLRAEDAGGNTIRLHSVLFQLTGDLYHYEHILHYLLLGRASVGPEVLHFVYWSMQRQLFLGVAGPEKAGSFLTCDLFRFYEALVRMVAGRWSLVPPRRAAGAGPIRRVAIVTNQFTGDQHQPSRDCFDFARLLMEDHRLDVAIINANLLPLRVESVFIPPMLADLVERYEGVVALEMFGRRVKMASFTERAFSRAKLTAIVEAVDGYDPDVVVAFGGSNLVADLFALAGARPVVCVPTTSGPTISLANITLGFEETDHTRQIPPAYRRPFSRRFRPFTFGYTLPPLEEALPLPDLPEAPFLFAVVGNRLAHEVDAAFLALLDDLLDACPGAAVVLAGAAPELPSRLAGCRHADRLRALGHVRDIRRFYRRCGALLNPPRSGGGGSAAYALAEGVPVVSYAHGDVASVAGPEALVADRGAYLERARRLFADVAFRQDAAERARARFTAVADRHRATARLLAYCEEARTLFAAGPTS